MIGKGIGLLGMWGFMAYTLKILVPEFIKIESEGASIVLAVFIFMAVLFAICVTGSVLSAKK